jgi:hypothetical protein
VSHAPGASAARCIGEPVSWLRLERFHLGELEGADRRPIADHLAACDACSACFARIQGDEAVALAPLPAARPASVGRRTIFPGAAFASLTALAAAAALVVGVRGVDPAVGPGDEAVQTVRIKGGAVAFTLVREDGERVSGEDGVYRDGDRFKAVVTCPPGAGVGFDVVVREEDHASFPLAPGIRFGCGNDVAMPGAFRLTGSGDETVCLLWDESGAVDRADSLTLEAHGLCKHLSPAAR